MIQTKILVLVGLALNLWQSMALADTVQIEVLSAVVKNQRIANATVILQKNGAQSITGSTDSNGKVQLQSEFSDNQEALLIIKQPGYSDLVAKCPCNNLSYAMSPVMSNLDGYRIVLNWGSAPQDLDSHLIFENQHIYFGQKSGATASDALLDVDDADSFGPETITITKKHVGQPYVYAVHQFPHPGLDHENLQGSGARVLVYIGQSLVRSFYVPQQQSGNLWTVFRITPDGDFQDINQITQISASAQEVPQQVSQYLTTLEATNTTQAIQPNNEQANTLNQKGEAAYHAGQLLQAVDWYRQAIDLNPEFGQAYSNLGLAYQKAGRTAEAIWANRKAIALASGSSADKVRASSYFNIGKIYEDAGQLSDALSQYQAAALQNKNSVYDKAIARVSAAIRR